MFEQPSHHDEHHALIFYRQVTRERIIELLSPARDKSCAIAAINAGADAIYIGGPAFGARSAACNSLTDIDEITRYARQFDVRVYVTLNTTLRNDETEKARMMAWQLYDAGVDALIVQDYGLLEMDLPPIELHASTQIDTRTMEKAKWLSDIGFQQVVLARELGLSEIKKISENISAKVEVFVHGSLCVCYSGQCYLSECLTGRSANRGTCSQPCRLSWDLTSRNAATGKKTMLKQREYLLSLRDMDRSDSIGDLIEAGVDSMKIEGRLKDETYVKNVTAFYRRKIDDYLTLKGGCRASSGETTTTFIPNPERTFHRGKTDYFLHSTRKEGIAAPNTPKSTGVKIGVVEREAQSGDVWIKTLSEITLQNGDGLCFQRDGKQWEGCRVEKVLERDDRQGRSRAILKQDGVSINGLTGVTLFRNYDVNFEKQLSSNESAVRKKKVRMTLGETRNGYELSVSDNEGVFACVEIEGAERQDARNVEMARLSIDGLLRKTGDTIFEVDDVIINTRNHVPFIPKSLLSEARRKALQALWEAKEKQYQERRKGAKGVKIKYVPLPQGEDCHFDDYRANVTNDYALAFLKKCDLSNSCDIRKGLPVGEELMRCRHCVKYLIGGCGKDMGDLFLTHGKDRLKLDFDCKRCEMIVTNDKQV